MANSNLFAFDTALLARLDKYRIKPRKTHAGRIRGERLSPKKGISIEFADYRHYAPGDDLRHLDWNILARLDRANIRTYRDEEELPVYLMVDASSSMSFGEPSKHSAACNLAGFLGHIALCGSDAVYPIVLTNGASEIRSLRGRSSLRRLTQHLSGSMPEGSDLCGAIKRFCHASNLPGMAILLTDGLDPDFPATLRSLAGRGHEIVLIHTLSDVELEPDLEGDLRLIDSEDGSTIEITATGGVLQEYRRKLTRFCEELEATCRRIGAHYLLINSKDSPEDIIIRKLRRLGVVG
jgi:uncharacterized protein (DUF58 family)